MGSDGQSGAFERRGRIEGQRPRDGGGRLALGAIPPLVAEKILAQRAHIHQLQAKFEKNKPPPVEVPGLGTVSFGYATKPLELAPEESRFWEMTDDDELIDFLMGDLVAGLYMELTDEEWIGLPAGYAPLVTVLEFERHCQFEGWTAASNHRVDGMRMIVEAYRSLGLAEEAAALGAVTEALTRFPDCMDEAFDHGAWNDAAREAYASIPNPTPEFEDRIPVICAFVRANPRLFAAG